MAEKGGGQLPGSDAAAVIRHPDEGHAAVLQFRHHGGRPGVYGVLDQLLDDAGGALYDLPGGDEVRYVGGKLLNMGHSLPFFPVESGSLPYSITKFGVVCKRRVAGGVNAYTKCEAARSKPLLEGGGPRAAWRSHDAGGFHPKDEIPLQSGFYL